MHATCSQCHHRLKNVTTWAETTRRANEVSSDVGEDNSQEFLYRRALQLALDGVSEWLHSAPERGFGMVIVSYLNLADHYARRGNSRRCDHFREQAEAFVTLHAAYERTPLRTREVAQEYLKIVHAR